MPPPHLTYFPLSSFLPFLSLCEPPHSLHTLSPPRLPLPPAAFLPQVYALRRLVRGLGSGRQGARQGFATALSLLISSQRGAGGSKAAPGPLFVDAGDVLTLLDTCLEAGASMKAGVSEVPGGAAGVVEPPGGEGVLEMLMESKAGVNDRPGWCSGNRDGGVVFPPRKTWKSTAEGEGCWRGTIWDRMDKVAGRMPDPDPDPPPVTTEASAFCTAPLTLLRFVRYSFLTPPLPPLLMLAGGPGHPRGQAVWSRSPDALRPAVSARRRQGQCQAAGGQQGQGCRCGGD